MCVKWLLLLTWLEAAALEVDQDQLNVGILLPFLDSPELDSGAISLASAVLIDLELGKLRSPPTKQFILGCFSSQCELTNTSYVIPPTVPHMNVPTVHPDLLNITFHLRDTSRDSSIAARESLDFDGMNAVIGAAGNVVTDTAASILSVLKVVMISPFSQAGELVDKSRFPYLFRALPSYYRISKVTVDYMIYFGWPSFFVLYQDDEYGNAMRAGVNFFSELASRRNSVHFEAIPDFRATSQERVTVATNSAVQLISAGQYRLVGLLFADDFFTGNVVREVFRSHGLTSPRIQLLTDTFAVLQSEELGHFANFSGVHGLHGYANFSDPQIINTALTWTHITNDDVLGRMAEFQVDHWRSEPMMSHFSYLFTGLPTLEVLLIVGSFHILMNAFNNALHDGLTPREIRGDALKAYMSTTNFTSFGKNWIFDEDQDSAGDLMGIKFLVGGDEQTGKTVWNYFVLTPIFSDTIGVLKPFMEGRDADFPDGPLWATGDFGWLPPVELAGCEPGQRVLSWNETVMSEGAAGCTPCMPGTFTDTYNSAVCHDCPGGHYSFASATDCLACPLGKAATEGSPACIACPVGSFANSLASASCLPCAPGQHQNSTGQEGCVDCAAGTFAPGKRSESCWDCIPGQISVDARQTACIGCEPGQFESQGGSTSCEPCAAGSYAEGDDSSKCTLCSPGKYKEEEMSNTSCTRCPLGTYSNISGASACVACRYGSTLYLAAESVDDCTCARGQFLVKAASIDGNFACKVCDEEYMEACPGGDVDAYQKKGFHVTPDGENVYRCSSEDACPGGLLGTCPTGSSGRGCATCDSDHFWDGDKCSLCGTRNGAIGFMLVAVAIIFFFVVHIYGNSPVGKSLTPFSDFIVIAGLAASLFFFMSSFSGLSVDWEEPIDTMLHISNVVSQQATSSQLTCSLGGGAFLTFALSSVTPLVTALGCCLSVVLGLATAKRLFNSYCTMVYACFLLLVLQSLRPFRYLVHPNNDKSMLSLPSVFEGSDEHWQYVITGMLCLLFYCVSFSAACLWACRAMTRDKLPATRRWYLTCFRFLFYRFRPAAFHWGIVILSRNLAFAVVPSLLPARPSVGVFLLTAIASCSAFHTGLVMPWRTRWLNFIDVGMLLYIVMLLNLAAGWSRKGGQEDAVLATLLAAAACVASLSILSYAIVLVGQNFLDNRGKRKQLKKALKDADEIYTMEMLQMAEKGTGVSDAFVLLHEETNKDLDGSRKPDIVKAQALHPLLANLKKVEGKLDAMVGIVRHIRENDYSVLSFYEDCVDAFPELSLYSGRACDPAHVTATPLDLRSSSSESSHTSSGLTGYEEQQRTIGALFAIYWICRLDIDGRKGMAFGTDPSNMHKVADIPSGLTPESIKEVAWGAMTPDQRRAHFYFNFRWELMEELFLVAGVTRKEGDKIVVDSSPSGRLVALLSLTAYHDIMKNPQLCPRVADEPYAGFAAGEQINDHDLALAYVLDRHPKVLPSFLVLSPEQRAVVRFTQSEMGFNAGWLVQAEGPPGAVLSKLKSAVTRGAANDEDVAFYFTHWVTDLAGAEPTPFRGSEKFAVKFPPHVLQSLMGSFPVVKMLGSHTETEVYEQYLTMRWEEHVESLGPVPQGLGSIARMRIHCMGQQAAMPLLNAFEELEEEDKLLLSREMAETGLPGQDFSEHKLTNDLGAGTPFLTYYGPAWCQRAGQAHPKFCLQILATVFRAARTVYPESMSNEEEEQNAGLSHRTLQLGVLKSHDLDGLLAVGADCIEVNRDNHREATVALKIIDF